jgi:hypothetical protein
LFKGFCYSVRIQLELNFLTFFHLSKNQLKDYSDTNKWQSRNSIRNNFQSSCHYDGWKSEINIVKWLFFCSFLLFSPNICHLEKKDCLTPFTFYLKLCPKTFLSMQCDGSKHLRLKLSWPQKVLQVISALSREKLMKLVVA